LRELAHDVRRLMTLAYPGEQSCLSEHIARAGFLSALADPEFELMIRARKPVDLDDALKIAHRFEVFKSVVESSTFMRFRVNRQATKFGFSEKSTSESGKRERRQQQGQS